MEGDKESRNELEVWGNELIDLVKGQARAWRKAFFVVIICWLLTIAGFLWYISLPVEESSVTQETDSGGNNYNVGGDFNGETESSLQTEGNAEPGQ